MGIFKGIRTAWKTADTAGKISMVVDVLCGVGSGLLSIDLGEGLAQGHGRFGRACIKLTVAGGTLALGNAAAKALNESYAEPLGMIIDGVKAKAAEKAKKEDAE